MSSTRSLSLPHHSFSFIFQVSSARLCTLQYLLFLLLTLFVPAHPPPAAMSASFSADEKYELMTRNLQEVLGGDKIKAILAKGETVKCYWGKSNYPDVVLDLRERTDELTFACLLPSLFLPAQEPLLPVDVSSLRSRFKVWDLDLTLSFVSVSSSHRLLCTLHQDR
jgi:hypothetical protein